MPTAHITSSDPVDLASDAIELRSITPTTPRSYLEVLSSAGQYRADALKVLNPLEQWDLTYWLKDTASLVIPFGVALNTNYLVTAFSCSCGPKTYPVVNLSVIKPSAANLIKAYPNTVELTIVGGMGIVNKFGATSTESFISSQCSVSMQGLDADHETSGDFEVGGIYRFGFKQEVQVSAYAAITIPVGAHAYPNAPTTPTETAEGWQQFNASFWTYLDPHTSP